MKSMQPSDNNENPWLGVNDRYKIISRLEYFKTFFDDPKVFSGRSINKQQRPSFIKVAQSSHNYGHITNQIVEPPSSGEESGMENAKTDEPSLLDVSHTICDLNTIMTVKCLDHFPKEATPSLLFSNMDDWITSFYVKEFIEEVPVLIKDGTIPDVADVKIFKLQKKTYAFVQFKKIKDMESIEKFFNHPCKKKTPSKNSKGEAIEVSIAFDLLELTLSNWYGVILRNLPPNCTSDSIKSFSESYTPGVLYCLHPMIVKQYFCSIVVMADLEEAEKLCMTLNGKEVSKYRKIKAHLHPRICKIRKNHSISQYYQMFNKNGYKFSKEIQQSSMILKNATPLTKIHNMSVQPTVQENSTGEKTQLNKTAKPVKEIPNRRDNKNQVIFPTKSNQTTKIQERNMTMYTSLLGSIFSTPTITSKTGSEVENKNESSNQQGNPTNPKNKDQDLQIDDPKHDPQAYIPIKSNPKQVINGICQKKKTQFPLNKVMSDLGKTLEQMVNQECSHEEFEYDPKELDFYTYDMKDKAYYDRPQKKRSVKKEINQNKNQNITTENLPQQELPSKGISNNGNNINRQNYNNGSITMNTTQIIQNQNPMIINNVSINMIHHPGNLSSQIPNSFNSFIYANDLNNLLFKSNGQLISEMAFLKEEAEKVASKSIEKLVVPSKEEDLPPLPRDQPPEPLNDNETQMEIVVNLNLSKEKTEPCRDEDKKHKIEIKKIPVQWKYESDHRRKKYRRSRSRTRSRYDYHRRSHHRRESSRYARKCSRYSRKSSRSSSYSRLGRYKSKKGYYDNNEEGQYYKKINEAHKSFIDNISTDEDKIRPRNGSEKM